MRLSLQTKLTLAISFLVLAVVAVVSTLYLALFTRSNLRQHQDQVSVFADQLFGACQAAIQEWAERGNAPRSANPADMRAYFQQAFDNNPALTGQIETDSGFPSVYEISITDNSGAVIASSDSSLLDQPLPARPSLESLTRAGFFRQLRELDGPSSVYEFARHYDVQGTAFGYVIRISLTSTLLWNEISPRLKSAAWWALGAVLISTFLVALVSRFAFAPIGRISAQLDAISAGHFDAEPALERRDELGAVSTKIVGLGKQLRDVREVFSTLRENLDQVMGGLADGLLLFGADGRAVLASPSVGKFLGVDPPELRGRHAAEIFPPGHALRAVLRIQGDEIAPVENAETPLDAIGGPQRCGVTAQVIREHGARMGTLVTLRDLESFERIGTQLEVSERLAALGRVTAGVAHEVKNPLNSMRLWLEVLKVNMPVAPEPQQAVKMLDSEIDRLDRAVKTFLNFTRPLELKLEEADLRSVVEEVLDAARPAVAKAGLSFQVDLPADSLPVMLDRQLIHQAILNLILNACDFTDPGGRIALHLQRADDSARISVRDSGKGIPPENQKKIFQLFFTTRRGGTGIGLANTFRFVQLHNGRIEFESQSGRGTVFHIELPLVRTGEPVTDRQEPEEPGGPPSAHAGSAGLQPLGEEKR